MKVICFELFIVIIDIIINMMHINVLAYSAVRHITKEKIWKLPRSPSFLKS